MCTVSWLIERDRYSVFFNRDELKTRAAALPPEIRSNEGVEYIAPFDPQGGGTWIGANRFGFACCLLNDYSAGFSGVPARNPLSRGLIVRSLLPCDSQRSALARLNSLDLANWRPFSLLLFEVGTSPVLFHWNGNALRVIQDPQQPHSSSSFDTFNVLEARRNAFPKNPGTRELESYHAFHAPEGGPYSVCMHRADAETVSFSRIDVHADYIQFDYLPASPCRRVTTELQQIRMAR